MNTLQAGAEASWLAHAAAAAILYAHIAGGTVGLLSGAAAMVFPKGARLHRLAGHAFFASMLVMGSIGAAVAPFLVSLEGDPKLFDALVGSFTCYLVATGWVTVRRKAGTIGRFENAAFACALLLAAAAVLVGVEASGRASGTLGGFGAEGYFVLGGIIAMAAAFDAKVVLSGGITGVPRVARHLWRLCVALFLAAGAFFLGLQRVMPEFMQGSALLAIPPLATLVLMAFWLIKLRLTKRINQFKRKRRAARREAAALAGAA